ncbi:hypothetical protein EDC96DRAFT_594746 [Choanephora cucurbitarum]|nr:hypothetical protein EDC96DRAFT_594746 [Choanephora cucurbitarum]
MISQRTECAIVPRRKMATRLQRMDQGLIPALREEQFSPTKKSMKQHSGAVISKATNTITSQQKRSWQKMISQRTECAIVPRRKMATRLQRMDQGLIPALREEQFSPTKKSMKQHSGAVISKATNTITSQQKRSWQKMISQRTECAIVPRRKMATRLQRMDQGLIPALREEQFSPTKKSMKQHSGAVISKATNTITSQQKRSWQKMISQRTECAIVPRRKMATRLQRMDQGLIPALREEHTIGKLLWPNHGIV